MSSFNTETIRLVIIDDHVMFREGLVLLLEERSGLKIVGQFDSATEALSSLKGTEVDVALLDANPGVERAFDFVVAARGEGFRGRILLLTAGISHQAAMQLVQAGIGGIVHKQNSTEVLLKTIRRVAHGEVSLEKAYLASLYRNTTPNRPAKLTQRDRAMARCILEGLANSEIAQRMELSESSVKTSLREVFAKFNVRTRAQAVKVALEQYRDQL